MRILILDLFDTVLNDVGVLDFNRGLEILWKKHFSEMCDFGDMKNYGAALFDQMRKVQSENLEFGFVRNELPLYCKRFRVPEFEMNADEEFEFANAIGAEEFLADTKATLDELKKRNIPMYVLSNSIFSTDVLKKILDKYGALGYFKEVWSSADFGRRKPDRSFFDMAVEHVLEDNPGSTREDIVFIGNSYHYDVMGGCGADLRTVWLNVKAQANEDNLPVLSIDKMSCLLKVLDK